MSTWKSPRKEMSPCDRAVKGKLLHKGLCDGKIIEACNFFLNVMFQERGQDG